MRKEGEYTVPQDRFNLALRWQHNSFSASWQSYFIGEMEERLNQGGTDFTHIVDSSLMHNLNIKYDLDQFNSQITLGVSNLFDEAPPFVGGRNGNNADAIHSPLYMGREYYLGLKTSF